jgi:hypothetical protein
MRGLDAAQGFVAVIAPSPRIAHHHLGEPAGSHR